MNKGIQVEELNGEQVVGFMRMRSYVVPSGMRHQIIHSNYKKHRGIAISKNGRRGFRKYDSNIVYWYTCPYAYVVSRPMKSQGIVVDLSHLV